MITPRFETLTFDRSLKAPIEHVFRAFAMPEARAVWAPPTPDLNMRYTAQDFRPGGRDLCVCGPGPAEGVEVETLYHAISEPALIHFTEVLRMGEAPEGTTLVTVVLTAQGSQTRLDLTLQVTSLGESNAAAEMSEGWTAALGNLEQWLQRPN